jgi:hypothetical protein
MAPKKKKKKVDPLKAKQQKQKIFVVAGGILLLLVFAFEAKSLGLIGGKQAAPPPVAAPAGTSTAPNSLTPPAIPGAGTAAPASAPSGSLVDTDAPVSSSEGQLVSFDVFETKNPFAPQVHRDQAGDAAAEPAPATDEAPTPADAPRADVPATGGTVTPSAERPTGITPSTEPPAGVAPSTEPPAGVTPATGTTTPTTPAAPRDTVTISVNGRSERVAKDGTFPSGAPVFRLVSWTSGTAKIGIVGGSYEDGGETLTLDRGQAVTLMNTSDGKKYKLVLVATA